MEVTRVYKTRQCIVLLKTMGFRKSARKTERFYAMGYERIDLKSLEIWLGPKVIAAIY